MLPALLFVILTKQHQLENDTWRIKVKPTPKKHIFSIKRIPNYWTSWLLSYTDAEKEQKWPMQNVTLRDSESSNH